MSSFASLNGAQKKKVSQLQQFICVSSRDELVAMLSAFDWDVQRAADAFYSGEWEVPAIPRGHKSTSSSVDSAKIEAWFAKYADTEDSMQAEGIGQFCEDLEVSPEDVVLLVISFHFQAENMLIYTKEEFVQGMESMGVDSVEALKAALPKLREELSEPTQFREVYNFTFKWACPMGQKSMPVETAVALWGILFSKDGSGESFDLLDDWIEYIEKNRKHAISKDEWSLLLEFARTVDAELNGYDENAAWPVVIDTFAEYVEDKRKK